jgi:hypothetical protein
LLLTGTCGNCGTRANSNNTINTKGHDWWLFGWEKSCLLWSARFPDRERIFFKICENFKPVLASRSFRLSQSDGMEKCTRQASHQTFSHNMAKRT